jgi:hypothetical protein
MDCRAREIRICLRDGQSTVKHIKRLHSVANVDYFSVGSDIQNDAFYGPDKMIVEPEVGG